MHFLYPRSKLVDAPVERQPVAIDEAASRIAEALAGQVPLPIRSIIVRH
jgi:hypothetical protein